MKMSPQQEERMIAALRIAPYHVCDSCFAIYDGIISSSSPCIQNIVTAYTMTGKRGDSAQR